MAYRPFFGNLVDIGGDPASGALIRTYLKGTTTPSAMATDSSGATPATNPVVADADGRFRVYANDAVNYTVRATTSDGATTILEADITAGVISITSISGNLYHEDWTQPLTDALVWADLASATTTELDAAGSNNIRITGTTTITSLGTADSGLHRTVRFAAALTLTHNGTSLILPGAANITTAADDTAEFVSLGSGNWICASYKRASGLPLGMGATWTTALADTTNNAAGNLGTIQAGSNTGTRTIKSKINDHFNLNDMYGVGVGNAEDAIAAGTDITAFINHAIALGKSSKKKLILPGRTLIHGRLTVANDGLPWHMEGQGDHLTTLYVNRTGWTNNGNAGAVMNCTAQTGLYLGGFKMDLDNAVFEDSGTPGNGTWALLLYAGSDQLIQNVTIDGYYYIGLYRALTVGCKTQDMRFDSESVYSRGILQNASGASGTRDNIDVDPRFYGTFDYPMTISDGENSTVRNPRLEGAAQFGFNMTNERNSRLIGGYAENTVYEAFNITDCDNVHYSGFQATWDMDWDTYDPSDNDVVGIDFGVSINGSTTGIGCRNCSMSDFIVENSYKAGAAIANEADRCRIYDFKTINSGLRYSQENPGDTTACSLLTGAGEDLAVYVGATCKNNSFSNGEVVFTEGTMPVGFGEFITTGRTNLNNSCENVTFTGVTTLENLSSGSGSWVMDAPDVIRTDAPTVLAGTANPTDATAATRYRREGKRTKGSTLIHVTTNGSAADWIGHTPTIALKTGGTGFQHLYGADVTGARPLSLTVVAGTFRLQVSGGTYPAGDNRDLRIDFEYEID